MNTCFAAAERQPRNKVINDYVFLSRTQPVDYFLNIGSDMVIILNDDRQIVYANRKFLKTFKFPEMEKIIGLRAGEAIGCIYSDLTEGGCGTANNCRYCDAVITVLRSQYKSCYEESEVKLQLKNGSSIDVRVTASPYVLDYNYYTIVSITDISQIKQKEVLEKVFFHDILNTAASIKNLWSIYNDYEDHDKEEIKNLTKKLADELVEQINYQRIVTESENGEYVVNCEKFSVHEMLHKLVRTFSYKSQFRKIKKYLDCPNLLEVNSDYILLYRAVFNLFKNALEASDDNQAVRISAEMINEKLYIYVNNKNSIPEDIRSKLFHKTFSTKGSNRGFGTYSAKLLVEKYLGGKVELKSDEVFGTTFRIIVPHNLTHNT
ncbi:MAG: PAS domain-containing sensor histidine kinase [Melioribacteraceae bacterium]|nr:PAS domain-containing sensor histidine kinase [Melioribacteraceae bacterium]